MEAAGGGGGGGGWSGKGRGRASRLITMPVLVIGHVRHTNIDNILRWLHGFQDKLLYLMVFPFLGIEGQKAL